MLLVAAPPQLPEDEHRIWFNTEQLGRREFDHAVLLFHVAKVKSLHPGRKFKVHFYKYSSGSDVSVASVDEVSLEAGCMSSRLLGIG